MNAPGFATNGFGDRSPGGYSFLSVAIAEIVMTAFFLIIILVATAKRAVAGFGGVAIGLALTLIHLITIPVSNTSVNPARSIGPALFAGSDAIIQLPVFIIAPIVGAALGALVWTTLLAGSEETELAEGVTPAPPDRHRRLARRRHDSVASE